MSEFTASCQKADNLTDRNRTKQMDAALKAPGQSSRPAQETGFLNGTLLFFPARKQEADATPMCTPMQSRKEGLSS